jgi:hypothetical protein
MTNPHPGLSPSALAGNGRQAPAFPRRPFHSQPHLLSDLISYQNDGKVGMVIVGEVGMA